MNTSKHGDKLDAPTKRRTDPVYNKPGPIGSGSSHKPARQAPSKGKTLQHQNGFYLAVYNPGDDNWRIYRQKDKANVLAFYDTDLEVLQFANVNNNYQYTLDEFADLINICRACNQ